MNDLKKFGLPINAKCVFKGKLFDTYQWEQELFDGSYAIFEKIVRLGSVQLICVTKNNKIILLNEEQPHRGKFISIPGGMIERDEIPINCAKKELLEELGMIFSDIKIFKIQNFGGKIHWPTYYYICKNCEKVSEPSLEPGEKIESFEVDFDDFIKQVLSDEFRNKNFQTMILKMIVENKINDFKKLLLN